MIKRFRGARVWFFLLILFLIIPVLIYATWLIEPSFPVNNVLISNVTDHQATVSWTTAVATKGTIIIGDDNEKFPLLPVFAKNSHKDDGEKLISRTGYYTTHHVTVGSLSPSQKYHFRIYQGQKKVYEGQFSTGPTLSGLSNPNPVYGKVVRGANRSGVAGAIVYYEITSSAYLTLQKDGTRSAILSTLTNQQGGWSMDLANLRSSDLNNNFKIPKAVVNQIVVEGGSQGRVKFATSSAYTKPWADIILK